MEALVLGRLQWNRIVPMDSTMNKVGRPFLWVGLATLYDARRALECCPGYYGGGPNPKLAQVMISCSHYRNRPLRYF